MWKHLPHAAATACVLALLGPSAHAAPRCAGGVSGQNPDEMRRHDTSKQRLQIQWSAYVPRTGSEKFDAAGALREIRGQNPKPIFLLRDCDTCSGKDDAFVEKSLQDEKVVLASHWFHCVRVDRGVLKDSHPLNSLFAASKPPHIILVSSGNDRADLDGRVTRVLWEAICQTLKKDYKKSPEAAMTSWIALLSRFDSLDTRKAELVSKRQASTDPRKATDIDKKLLEVDHEIASAVDEEKKIKDLELRPPTTPAGAPVDNDAEAAEAVSKAKAKPSLLDKVKKDQEKKDQEKKEPEKKEPEPGKEKK